MLTLKELSERAFEMGREAARKGERSAPAFNEEFMQMMRESMVTDWTQPLQSYVRGHQAFTDRPTE